MKALCWHGRNDVRIDNVPDPTILNPRDAIIKVTATAICGSDLHLYNGFIPTLMEGDILGHEFMGEVVELGSEVKNLKKGDRVVVPFTIACGQCFFCQKTTVVALRQLQPERGAGGEDVRLHALRAVRLLASAGRLRGRAGGVCARALRGCRPVQGAGRVCGTIRCCS